MKKMLWIAAVVALSGCASGPPPGPRIISPEMAQRMSVVDLCVGLGVWGPISSGNAADELHRRGLECRDFSAAIQARLQADAQEQLQRHALAQNLLLQNMQRGAPLTAYQMQQPIRCTTQRFGDTFQSVCR